MSWAVDVIRGATSVLVPDTLRQSVFEGITASGGTERLDALRKVAVATGEGRSLEWFRNEALGWLVVLHDLDAGPLFANAYQLGLTSTGLEPRDAPEIAHVAWQGGARRGLGWLRFVTDGQGVRNGGPFGWTPEEIAKLADPCLATGLYEPWEDLADWRSTNLDLPMAVATVAAKRLQQLGDTASGQQRHDIFYGLARALTDDPAGAASLRLLINASLQDQRSWFRADVLQWIANEYVRSHALDEGIDGAVAERLTDSDPKVVARAIDVYGQTRASSRFDDIAALLGSDSPEVRGAAVQALVRIDEDRGVEASLGALADPQLTGTLCSVAHRTMDRRLVPLLVSALKGGSEAERKAAREALDDIAFYVSQKQRWQRLLDGSGLDAPNAAEALLKQAREAKDMKIRIVAIESLGTLAVPETLPFLIQMMQDPDPEIAKAASAAVDEINAGKAK